MPNVVDAIGGLAHQKRLQIFLHRRNNQIRSLGKSSATVAVETILVSGDLHHHQPQALRRGSDNADVLNMGDRQPARSALHFSLRRQFSARHRSRECGLQHFTPIDQSPIGQSMTLRTTRILAMTTRQEKRRIVNGGSGIAAAMNSLSIWLISA